jgi:hypothetical protein
LERAPPKFADQLSVTRQFIVSLSRIDSHRATPMERDRHRKGKCRKSNGCVKRPAFQGISSMAYQ